MPVVSCGSPPPQCSMAPFMEGLRTSGALSNAHGNYREERHSDSATIQSLRCAELQIKCPGEVAVLEYGVLSGSVRQDDKEALQSRPPSADAGNLTIVGINMNCPTSK